MSYILIIDDDVDFADAAATALRTSGHEVAIEPDIDNAITNLRSRRPDLVILDVMFPEDPSHGFSLARELKTEHEDLKDIPLLMVTAINANSPLGFSARDIDETWLPVSDFLEKPVELEALRNKVNDMLAPAGS
ncbi:MAG: response regulator [Planctomycetota bacterium]|jgi:CheY-like chemotaxis protein